ncbi:hypothetical protein AAFF_G00171080 [Aldrovandia affinis]|uniref:Uncharacterized protein n=1 Tax=Aldrovandia affinis TaxID=143900 RepID=A0AAD7RLQ1_9TELE|nr:hypothetical protein AAFF_G00171080 [Aldrovandia affinis]
MRWREQTGEQHGIVSRLTARGAEIMIWLYTPGIITRHHSVPQTGRSDPGWSGAAIETPHWSVMMRSIFMNLPASRRELAARRRGVIVMRAALQQLGPRSSAETAGLR